MGTHPNTLLVLHLTPDEGSRKTHRAIMEGLGIEHDDEIEIGDDTYHVEVAESDYIEDRQIACKEGDIVLWDPVTYGYGEVIGWDALVEHKNRLEEWAKGICERHKCSYRIEVTANYW
jgi:hypothetical protein